MYRALLFKAEGNGVMVYLAHSEPTDDLATAMAFAEDLKRDRPKEAFRAHVVSRTSAPSYFA